MLSFQLLEAANGAAGSSLAMILPMILIFVLMYFMLMRPQKKQQKMEQEMRNSLKIGDEITTIGGIMGRIVTVKDDSIIIETGADRNKMKITRWAVQANNTAMERDRQEREAAKAAADKAKADKKKEEGRRIIFTLFFLYCNMK